MLISRCKEFFAAFVYGNTLLVTVAVSVGIWLLLPVVKRAASVNISMNFAAATPRNGQSLSTRSNPGEQTKGAGYCAA
jgi:hypothetical protein